MARPTAALDVRYSDAAAAAIPWAEAEACLRAAELSLLTTLRPDGRPHSTPLVGVWHDDALHFCVGAEEQKARNIAHDPRAMLTTGGLRWDVGLEVVVEGQARRVTDGDRLHALAEAWAPKWDGRWRWGVGEGVFLHGDNTTEALVYSVTPTTAWAYGKTPFSHTRYHW